MATEKRHGFIALAYDAAYQSESEGEPRYLEDPSQRVEDIKIAATFLIGTNGVDKERIRVLGICASGGYVCSAAQTGLRIKSVSTISAVCTGVIAREGLPKGSSDFEMLRGQLAASAKERNDEAKGSNPTLVAMSPKTSEDVPASMPIVFRDLISYYRTLCGMHPRATNKFNHLISTLPLLMIVGSKAESKSYSEDALKLAKDPKELFVTPDKTYADLCDDYHGTIPKLVSVLESSLSR